MLLAALRERLPPARHPTGLPISGFLPSARATKRRQQGEREVIALTSPQATPLDKSETMRALLLSALAATTIVASTAMTLASDATAAVRPHHHTRLAPYRAHVAPYVRQDPSRSFNSFDPPAVEADPYLNYRWPPSGGAT